MSPPVCCERNDDGPDYLRMILTSRVYDVCKETPCSLAVGMSSRLGAQIYFKREDLQPVFSFKLRGAYNMMAQLSEDDRWKGVISVSAGNHAQGVAYSAEKLGIPATIVMPTATPSIKSDNVRRLGANVILHGENFDDAKAEGMRLEKEHGLKYIPPFDDPYVIAGQGTIGLEILRQIDVQSLKAVFVAVGGGGLIAGVGAYIKRIAPHVKVIGVETYDADAMYQSLKAGKLCELKDVGLFADGTAVRSVGVETFRVSQQCVDEVVRVNTDELCAAIGAAFKETRSVMEPSGALSVAGLEKWLGEHKGEYTEEDKFCAVLSGANMDFDRLRFVSERSKLGAGREVFFVVQMRDQPGEFKKLIDLLSPRAITEFSYRYKSESAAHVYCSFTCQNRQEIPALMASIAEIGQTAYDVSDNDLAKTHARYLVGGSPSLESERIFRFRFPERPGALQRFLDALPVNHNVSLFHYRNYGSDVGSILAGIVAPVDEASEVDESLKKTGYWYEEETDNLAYKLFLK